MRLIALLCFAPALAFAAHPLDPLTKDEIALAAKVVTASKDFPKGSLFPVVALKEPPKEEVLAYTKGPARREALVVVLDRAAGVTYEAVVDLVKQQLASWTAVPGKQPLVLLEEYETVPKIVKADAKWQEAMKRRGITDFSKVWVDTWAVGHFMPKGSEKARLLRALTYLQDGAVNFYDRPIEGVTAVVDLGAGKVIELIDTEAVPLPTEHTELDDKALGPSRKGLKPLVATMSQGASYKLDGQEVRWEKWRFRWAMHPREGLVIYDVRWDDGAPATRPVMYRGSLSEMVVPYGDPDQHWVWRNAFDEGEYGVGRLASPLEAGMDAPKHAKLFDVTFADDFGKPYVLNRAVGLYERDAGILWKHYDIYHDKNQTRRARQLVMFFIATIGNYDYAINWVFHQDGVIEVVCDLSGIMLAKGVKEATLEGGHHGTPADLKYSHLVAPYVSAPHHQHYFNFRLDMDVDGPANSVYEMNTRAAPAGKDNPYGNAILMEETNLGSEKAAQRDQQMSSARLWRIGNAGKKNSLGYNPSYLLAPGGNAVSYQSPDSLVRQRARFIDHHFWATRYKEAERHAAGWYPSQSTTGEGLLDYGKDDEKLSQEDVVVWYTVGITHIPRPEEWPIMTVHQLGFKLLPAGFFTKSPALDVPRLGN